MNGMKLLWTALCALALAFPLAAQSETFEWQPEVQLRGSNADPDSHFYGGSFVQRVDGKMLVTYRSGDKVMLSSVDSEDELLTVDNASATNEWVFKTLYSPDHGSNDSRLQRLKSGRLLLYVVEYGAPADPQRPFRVDVYESKNGLGTDFRLKSHLVEQSLLFYTFGARTIGNAIEMKGKIYLPLALPTAYFGPDRLDSTLYCAISSDGGKTWSLDRIALANTWRNPTRGFGIAKDRVIVLDQNYYGGGTTIFRSRSISELRVPDSQGEWRAAAPYQQATMGDMVESHVYYAPDGYSYFQYNQDSSRKYRVYRRPSKSPIDDTNAQVPYQVGLQGSGATWEGPLNADAYGDDGAEALSISPSGHIVLSGTSTSAGTSSHLYVGRRVQP